MDRVEQQNSVQHSVIEASGIGALGGVAWDFVAKKGEGPRFFPFYIFYI